MYTNILRLVNEYIIEEQIDELPMRTQTLADLIQRSGFALATYSEAAELIQIFELSAYTSSFPAFTFISDEIRVVLYSDELSTSDKLFSLAHELGHIVLQHSAEGVRGMTVQKQNAQEQEADIFAYQILAPVCVLKKLKIHTPQEIAKETLLDETRAEIVCENLKTFSDDYCKNVIISQYLRARSGGRERKILALLLALYVLICFLLVFLISDPMAAFRNTPANLVYYTTPQGIYYHQKDCPLLQDRIDCTACSKAQCIRKGLAPCPECIPGEPIVREKIHLLSFPASRFPTPRKPLGNLPCPMFCLSETTAEMQTPADAQK